MAKDMPQEGAPQPIPALPPGMADIKNQSVDEVLAEMNRVPLFMTTLDETDGAGGENVALEAMKALAYEGTKAEIAENFRQQGNECARAKQWGDAKEFYDKAIGALKAPKKAPEPEAAGVPEWEGERVVDVTEEVEVDEEEEARKEKAIEEACYVNRALCNLEKKNYRSCNQDCASTLRLNPSNVKAFYRSGTACLALDKLPEATDACSRGLELDPSNAPLKALQTKITARKAYIESIEKARQEREAKAASERATLALALKARGIKTRTTEQAPDLEDASIKLENPMDPSSTLTFPVILLYPSHGQSDFVKAFSEFDTITQHLDYIFPLPWDESKEYSPDGVEAYMETLNGGLMKVGKKMKLHKILGSGKCDIADGLVRINIVPKGRAEDFIATRNKQKGQS
ncbi:TPR repeat protein-like protein [Massarina eburnea CBS 473.64]|uniref:TPR repeat protein-like protein n=1 Tax=Massarina eburnea CBS 473.64 TaxID=1395130 RepID=A0A6A6RYU4_9PLEO|nr:TPR repeat protein-like protein [Massarina eburnea CBS 473.64]